MAKIPKGGAGSSRGLPRTTGQAHRSAGTELINEGFGKAFTKSPVLLRPFRAFFDGITGSTHHNWYGHGWEKNGEMVNLNAWQKQLRRSRANLNTLMTGKRTHAGSGVTLAKDENAGFLKRQWNRAWSVPHVVTNMTAGMGLASAGWGTRVAVGAAGYGGLHAARGIARFTGATALEAALAGKEIAKGGTGLMRFPFMGDAILVGGTASVGIGGLALAMNEVNGVAKSFNGYASSLAGTTGMTPTPLVNTGADGDLVFAMHKLR